MNLRRVPEPMFFRRPERPHAPTSLAPPSATAPEPLVHFWPVAVAGGIALLLLMALIAWLTTHPPRQVRGAMPVPTTAPTLAVRSTPAPKPVAAVLPPRRPAPSVVAPARAVPAMPAPPPPPVRKAVAPAVLASLPALPPAPPQLPLSVPPIVRAATPPPVEKEPEPMSPAMPAPVAPPATPPAPPPDRRGETYGTSVLFWNNPAEATREAKKAEKLLFVLHVSGNFEEACFT